MSFITAAVSQRWLRPIATQLPSGRNWEPSDQHWPATGKADWLDEGCYSTAAPC